VAYDSGRVLQRCLDCLLAQTRTADRIVVVDNNSPSPSYLDRIPASAAVRLVRLPRNEGYCRANNLAYAMVRDCRYVVFLNPDAFLSERFLEQALSWMEQPDNASVACLTGTLLGFDVERGGPTGLIDSTGIFQKWYGRWYDRGRGAPSHELTTVAAEEVPAACGALMFCKTEALEDVSLRAGEVFDPAFFMYKEDIDLSIRMRSRGWRIMYVPALLCHHVRGWQGRQSVTRKARYLSTRNELRLCIRNGGRGLPYGLAKYVYIMAIEPLLLSLQRHLTRPA
jgi:GT2 family glycosyltransferase